MDPILLVDDEKDNLDAIKRLLRNEYDVTATDSPLEALKLINNQRFAVIVSDQRMPEITGVELLEKASAVYPDTVRILLTGYTDIESVIEAINRGNIYRYIAKPWDPEDLRMTLRQACEAYNLRKELGQKSNALSKTNYELRNALENVRLLDQAKHRFLSLVSHELNTPITVLNAFMELLGAHEAEMGAEIRQAFDSMRSASDRLSEIVSEVLLYTRLEAETDWEPKPFDWEKETIAVVNLLDPQRRMRKVSVRLKTKGKANAQCSPANMKTALTKLLAETILRAAPDSEVRVLMGTDSEGFFFRIQRQGEVVSQQALEPLEIGEDVLRHGKNLGLSLAICRFIIERHGGKISLQSTEEETTVEFRLP